jgi:hypothetical protein
MRHLIDLMNVPGRPLFRYGMPGPTEADEQQERKNEDRRYPPTRPPHDASADQQEGKHKVPAPRPPEAGAGQHLAYRIGIEQRESRAGNIRGHCEEQAQRRQQCHDGADGRHTTKPGIEGGQNVGRSRGCIAAEPVKPEGAAAEDHDCGRELQKALKDQRLSHDLTLCRASLFDLKGKTAFGRMTIDRYDLPRDLVSAGRKHRQRQHKLSMVCGGDGRRPGLDRLSAGESERNGRK